MAVWALGINHTTAPLDLRGRFAFAVEKIAPTLAHLRATLATPEAAIISTCNRTEIYCADTSDISTAASQQVMEHTVNCSRVGSGRRVVTWQRRLLAQHVVY